MNDLYIKFVNSIFENQSIFDLCGILADIECFNLYHFKKETSNSPYCEKLSKVFNGYPVSDSNDVEEKCKFFFENIFIKYIDIFKEENIDINILFQEKIDEIENDYIKGINKLLKELKYSKEDLINYYNE